MSFEKSEIMKEYAKLMEPDLLKTAFSKNPNQEDIKTIKEKRIQSPEKNIIEEAHPEPVFVAESRGDGALVENQNEQHAKLMEIINKAPTGSLAGNYASAINVLVKMANACDEINEPEAADILTDAATKVVELIGVLPFDKAPAK